jgi:hypothetical protein
MMQMPSQSLVYKILLIILKMFVAGFFGYCASLFYITNYTLMFAGILGHLGVYFFEYLLEHFSRKPL